MKPRCGGGLGALSGGPASAASAKVQDGTRLRLVHSGFVLPKNDTAFKNMNEGWKKVMTRLATMAGELH